MKRIISCLLLFVLLCGCSILKKVPSVTSYPDETLINGETYYNFELRALDLETAYLNPGEKDDLEKLCGALDVMRLDKPQFYQMVIKYFPILFEEFNAEDLSGYFGFDTYYATYIYALMLENHRDDFRELYFEFKGKAQNIYTYARRLYSLALGKLENLTEEDHTFLYDEAVCLVEQAKQDEVDFNSMLSAYGCMLEICDVMGKDDELESVAKEFKALVEEHSAANGD